MNCAYETQCSKGDDRGMKYSVSPFMCTKCEIVTNCITGEAERRSGPISLSIVPRCSTCNSSDDLVKWDLLSCPKCNTKQMHYHYLSIPWD